MKNKNVAMIGTGFAYVLAFLFIILKICGVIFLVMGLGLESDMDLRNHHGGRVCIRHSSPKVIVLVCGFAGMITSLY